MQYRFNRRLFLLSSLLGGAITKGSRSLADSLKAPGVAIRSKSPDQDRGPEPIGLARSAAYPETESTVTIADPARLKVLQLTDVHFFCTPNNPGRDKRTLEELPRLVDLAQPDMLLVTGDLWHENPEGRGAEYMAFSVDTMAKIGIPWAFTWGNHDTLTDYVKGHDVLRTAKHSLYRGGPAGGNYVVRILNASGKQIWRFVCMNSSCQGLHAEQGEWIRALSSKEDQDSGAFAVFHIPIKQFDTIWLEKKASGIRLETPCIEEDQDGVFSSLQALKGLKGCICGHDHINDYEGNYEGVDLMYGRATGYGGYGADTVPKGAKYYEINTETGAYTWVSLTADGGRWRPDAGQQISRRLDAPWAKRKT